MARADKSNRGVLITEESARRIARAVQKLEQGSRNVPGRKMRTAFDEGDSEIRRGRFEGLWQYAANKEVELLDRADDEDETVNVVNVYISLNPTSVCDVLIARIRADWWLVQADLTKQEGFNGQTVQAFGHDALGRAKWFSTVDCAEQGSS